VFYFLARLGSPKGRLRRTLDIADFAKNLHPEREYLLVIGKTFTASPNAEQQTSQLRLAFLFRQKQKDRLGYRT
jgi:hypothetical protein